MYDICMHDTEKYEMKCCAQKCMTDKDLLPKHAQLNKNFEKRKKCISNPNPNLFFVSFFIFSFFVKLHNLNHLLFKKIFFLGK